MSTLLDLDFASNVSAFTGGAPAWSSAAGPDFQSGIASFTTSNTGNRAILSFEEQSSGHTIVSFWYYVSDTTTGTNTSSQDDFVYLFPSATDANSGSSTSGATALVFSRNTANSGTSARTMLQHRNSSGFQNLYLHTRQKWYRVAIDIDQTNDKYDVYVDGRLAATDQTVANTSSGTIGKIVFLHQSSSTTTLFDNIQVFSSPTGYEASTNLLLSVDYTTSVDGEIEDIYPDIDNRSLYKQPHKIADDTTTYGAFTVNANGAVPDSNKQCGALLRATSEGTVELDCKAASSGNIGASIIDRVWAGLDDDSYLELRYNKAATGAELRLYQGTTAVGAGVTPDDNAATTAGTNYTLKMVRRGRVIDCYFNGIFEVSYTIISTGNRGQLSEEHVGFYIDTRTSGLNLGTTNYVRALRVYGDAPQDNNGNPTANLPPVSERMVAGGMTWAIEAEGVLEAYASGYANPTRNLVWSKWMQTAHLSEADPNKYGSRYERLYSGNSLRSFHFASHNKREDTYLGNGAYGYFTVTPRGIWIREGIEYFNAAGVSDYAPDNDFRTELWSNVIAHSRRTAAGTVTHGSTTKGFATWATIFTGVDSGAFQVVTNNGSGNLALATCYCGQLGGNIDSDVLYLSAKRLGCMDPMSLAFTISRNTIANGESVTASRLLMVDTGASVAADNTLRGNLLNDLEQPAALSVSTGSLVTDASGDADTDGFNEQHGWYELETTTNAVAFALDGVTDRVRPQFHIDGMVTVPNVFVDGVLQTEGTDYWWTPDGATGSLVGFTGTIAGDSVISISRQRFPIFGNN